MKNYLTIVFCIIISILIINCDDEPEIHLMTQDQCPTINETRCVDGFIQRCNLYDYSQSSFVSDDDSLLKYAQETERIMTSHHLHHGLLTENLMDSEEIVFGHEHVVQYQGCGDSACWSGHYLVGEAHRYMCNHNEQAKQNIINMVSGLEMSFKIAQASGSDGLATRYWAEKSMTNTSAYHPDSTSPTDGYRDGDAPYEDYYWDGCISTDQYSGLMLGLNAAYEAISDEEVREKVRFCVTSMVDALMENNLMIKLAVPEGKTGRSFHEEIDGEYYLNFNMDSINNFGTHDNGIYVLTYTLMAYKMTGDEKYRDFYYNTLIAEKGAIEDMQKWNCVYGAGCFPIYEHYFNNNIAIISLYNLIFTETYDEELRQTYIDVMKNNFWENFKDEKNAWFSVLYSYAVNGTDQDALDVINTQLRLFTERPLRKIAVVLSEDDSRLVKDDSGNILPMDVNIRPFDFFIWQRGPNDYVSSESYNRPDYEYPGIDFTTLYWISRYHGFISEDQSEENSGLSWQETDEVCSP